MFSPSIKVAEPLGLNVPPASGIDFITRLYFFTGLITSGFEGLEGLYVYTAVSVTFFAGMVYLKP